MTLSDALHNILPFRKTRDQGKAAPALDIEKFIAERRHRLTVEEVDAICDRAIADANVDEQEVLREMDSLMNERNLKPVERARDSA